MLVHQRVKWGYHGMWNHRITPIGTGFTGPRADCHWIRPWRRWHRKRGLRLVAPKNEWLAVTIWNLTSGKLTKLWKITMFHGKTHYKWPFSIAMLNYQRVTMEKTGFNHPKLVLEHQKKDLTYLTIAIRCLNIEKMDTMILSPQTIQYHPDDPSLVQYWSVQFGVAYCGYSKL